MNNKAMERKLQDGNAIDIAGCERTSVGDYVLDRLFKDDIDYCDAAREEWVWSIGKTLVPLPAVMADGTRRVLPPGTFLASMSARHYSAGESEVTECVWLR
ncbi:MAG TPA: hypothetical protein VGG49_13275 [Steroidobacteraceae bacterium]